MRAKGYWLLLAIISLSLLGGCSKSDEEASAANKPKAAAEVALSPEQVGVAESRTVNPEFELTAVTEALQSAKIIPQVSARITKIHFKGGEMVEKGQLLIELDDAEYKANLTSAKAAVEAANANYTKTKSNWERAQRLRPDGFISQSDFDTAKAAVDSAKAELSQAKAELEQAELDITRTRIEAPFKGRISPPRHAVGDLVGKLSVIPLFELVQLDPIYVNASVKQQTYNHLTLLRNKLKAEGRDVPEIKVQLLMAGGETYPHEGVFHSWDDSENTAPGMIIGRTEFPNPDFILLPGQNVTLIGKAIEPVTSVFIPQRAVLQDQQGHYVLVIDDTNTLKRRNIEVGIRDGADWSVRTGLETGEKLITQGAQRLPPGTKVSVASPQ